MRIKSLVTTLTLVFVLLCSSVAYAWTIIEYYTVINHTSSQIQGYVVTGCDVTVDKITERGWLYRDGTLVKTNTGGGVNTDYSQCPVFASNPSGAQDWELDGSHTATYGGTTKGPWPSNSGLYGI